VGSIYATATKADAGAPVGPGRVTEIRRAVRVPIVGIGGITPGNAAAVIHAGAQGVAVITAVTLADDMSAAVRHLREAVDGAGAR
jgi:thiamine-phosphate pyrophosphorylase